MGVGTTNKRVDRATKLMGAILRVFVYDATLLLAEANGQNIEYFLMRCYAFAVDSGVSCNEEGRAHFWGFHSPFALRFFLIFSRTSMQLALMGSASRSSTLIFWLALLGPSRWCACVAGWTDLGWRYSLTFASLRDSSSMKSNASLSRTAFAMREGCGLIADGQACIDQPLEDPPRLR